MGGFILFLVFCIPAVIAWARDHSSRTAITIFSILNAFLLEITSIFGLFLGFILLLWAIIGRSKDKPEVKYIIKEHTENEKQVQKNDVVNQLVRLVEMKDKGMLSKEEYEIAKQRVLNKNVFNNSDSGSDVANSSISFNGSQNEEVEMPCIEKHESDENHDSTHEYSNSKCNDDFPAISSGSRFLCLVQNHVTSFFHRLFLYYPFVAGIVVSVVVIYIVGSSYGSSSSCVDVDNQTLPYFRVFDTEEPIVHPGRRIAPGQNLVYKVEIEHHLPEDSLKMLQDYFIHKGEKEFVGINKILVHVYLKGETWKPVPYAALNYIGKEKSIYINE